MTLYDLAEQKQLSPSDPLTVLKIDQVPGSGVLQYMRPGMTLSVNDAASLMVKYGLRVSTPNEMAHLFELLAQG